MWYKKGCSLINKFKVKSLKFKVGDKTGINCGDTEQAKTFRWWNFQHKPIECDGMFCLGWKRKLVGNSHLFSPFFAWSAKGRSSSRKDRIKSGSVRLRPLKSAYARLTRIFFSGLGGCRGSLQLDDAASLPRRVKPGQGKSRWILFTKNLIPDAVNSEIKLF